MKVRHKQKGAALILLVFVLSLAIITYLLHTLDSTEIQNQKNKKTAEVLSQAKQALLAYAGAVSLSTGCGTNCARPGELPCPDTDNDGVENTPCSVSSVGRLPWKSLGLPDLRDGDGERLWYAVSNRYRNNNPRVLPLNSDTRGTITLRNSSGTIAYDGSSSTGLVAVIIAPGAVITRQDSVVQTRDTTANQNNAVNYLDIALSEDNQNFAENTNNGFIMGPIKNGSGKTILNDQILPITRDEINQVMETRVLGEVKSALNTYYAGNGGNTYPFVAEFTDTTCLGNGDLSSSSNCREGASVLGRIPANSAGTWNLSSPLRGDNDGNWFQQNGWRELIFYAVSYRCVTGNTNCSGTANPWLTLNNSLVSPDNNKRYVLIASGKALSSQNSRSSNKTNINYYLEGINLAYWNSVFVRTTPLTSSINDRAVSLP